MRRGALLAAAGAGALALWASGCTGGGDSEQGPEAETAPAQEARGAGEPAAADGPPTTAVVGFDRIPGIVEEVQPSVVSVVVSGVGEGSGVVWDADGHVVTNAHVVQDARSARLVLASGEELEATLVAADPVTDLAVLRAERTDLPPAEFRDELPDVGELAIALGNPLGFENTVTAGIVSGVNRSIPSGGRTPALVDLVQTDAPISPGNSGGALVGADARVIGINVAYLPPGAGAVSLGFAIPATTVAVVVEQLLDTGTVVHAFLGVEPRPVTPAIAEELGLGVEEGALVFRVVPDSPAERAGIEPGDVLVGIAGETVATVEDLLTALRRHAPGDEVDVSVVRDGEELELGATLADRPASG